MRWIEPLAFALLVPVLQFISFGETFGLDGLMRNEWRLVPTTVSIALAVFGSLIVWTLVAGLVRLVTPAAKRARLGLWLRSLGVLAAWAAVFAYASFGEAKLSRVQELQSFQWSMLKVALGVVAAALVARVVQRAPATRA